MDKCIGKYNFPTVKKGDTFDGLVFTVSVNGTRLPLTGASIAIDLRVTPKGESVKRFSTDTDEGGITILTAGTTPTVDTGGDGQFMLDKQIIDVLANTYKYDIEIILANTTVKTYVGGTWIISQDVTYDS